MALLYGLIESCEQPQAVLADAGDETAAILRLALARDQPARLQAIEQPRYIGIFRHQPLADLATGRARLSRAAKNPQHVVLRRRQVRLLDRLVDAPPQTLRRQLNIQINLFFAAREGLGLLQLFLQSRRHDEQYSRYNDYCQEDERLPVDRSRRRPRAAHVSLKGIRSVQVQTAASRRACLPKRRRDTRSKSPPGPSCLIEHFSTGALRSALNQTVSAA